jgi:hypothetical protein
MIVIRGAMNIRPENKGRFLELLLQEAKEVRRLEGWMNFNIFENVRSKSLCYSTRSGKASSPLTLAELQQPLRKRVNSFFRC